METKHTSGPWYAGATLSSDFHFIRSINSDSGQVAKVRVGPVIEQDESLANARLIAAAPDLLAALEQVEAAFDSPGVVLPDWEPLFDALGSVRGAIRKVKGE